MIVDILKKIFIFSLFFYPLVSFAMTDAEIKEKFELLSEEVAIANEQYEDAEQKFNNLMSISGYTDFEFIASDKSGSTNGFRLHHLSLFFEKQISNKWRFFSEIEYEDAPKFEAEADTVTVIDTDGNPQTIDKFKAANGKIFVEAINVTYQWKQELSLRFGRFFTPAGLWSIDHYPSFVPTQERPQHIRRIFPQIVDGIDMLGTVGIGDSTFLNYNFYTGNGEGNTGKHDHNNDKAVGLKTSFLLPALSHTELGFSVYSDTFENNSEKTATGVHAKIRSGDFTFQAEYAKGEIEDTAGNTLDNEGYYAQFLYSMKDWTYGLRHDFYDDNTDAASESSKYGTVNTASVNYHSTDKVTLKFEIHDVDVEDPAAEDYKKAIASVVVYLGE